MIIQRKTLSVGTDKIYAVIIAFSILLIYILPALIYPKSTVADTNAQTSVGTIFYNDEGDGESTVEWIDPANVDASDDEKAVADLFLGEASQYLVVSGFDFDIPEGAVIEGIEVLVEKEQQSGNKIKDYAIRIVKDGDIGSEDKSISDSWVNPDNRKVTYGGATDLWSLEWIEEDINSEDFGFAIAAIREAARGNPHQLEARIDYIEITVYYTEGSPDPDPEPDPEDPQDQDITIDPMAPSTAAYGESFIVGATSSSLLEVSIEVEGVCLLEENEITITDSEGVCVITYYQEGNEEFNEVSEVEEVTAEKREIIIEAEEAGKVYGEEDPELTYTVSDSLVEGDEFSGSLEREEGETAGTYSILEGDLSLNEDYILTFIGADFIIEKAPSSIEITSVSPSPSEVDEVYTVYWEVSAHEALTGTVEVTGGSLCSTTVEAGECDIISTDAGIKALIATYSGDENFNGSESEAFEHEVISLEEEGNEEESEEDEEEESNDEEEDGGNSEEGSEEEEEEDEEEDSEEEEDEEEVGGSESGSSSSSSGGGGGGSAGSTSFGPQGVSLNQFGDQVIPGIIIANNNLPPQNPFILTPEDTSPEPSNPDIEELPNEPTVEEVIDTSNLALVGASGNSPFPLWLVIVFAIVAAAVFALTQIRTRRPY